eukprot:TRINITY_DN10166_c0_g1_i1.p1 TRINITY_DN10166_c0_g1~~TRINITY_DN10166_c0_g1_i1.p1  ORF type:complete len:159 (+),score=15.73 TRINITY_DN10166_c0_g1_i1:281-757(+)
MIWMIFMTKVTSQHLFKAMASLLEIRQASGSLAVWMQSHEDEGLFIELTDGSHVRGTLEHADGHMNLSIIDANVTIKPNFAPPPRSKRPHLYEAKGYRSLRFDRFFVVGNRIRFVEFDEAIPVAQSVKHLMKRTRIAQQHYQPKRKPSSASWKGAKKE